jgi:hypothetical protein
VKAIDIACPFVDPSAAFACGAKPGAPCRPIACSANVVLTHQSRITAAVKATRAANRARTHRGFSADRMLGKPASPPS